MRVFGERPPAAAAPAPVPATPKSGRGEAELPGLRPEDERGVEIDGRLEDEVDEETEAAKDED